MRSFAKAAVAAAIVLGAGQPQAAPTSVPAQQKFPTLKRLMQTGYYGDDYRFACAEGLHYACWYEPYGHRYCACWPGGYHPACPSGYHYACRYEPNGYRNCACY